MLTVHKVTAEFAGQTSNIAHWVMINSWLKRLVLFMPLLKCAQLVTNTMLLQFLVKKCCANFFCTWLVSAPTGSNLPKDWTVCWMIYDVAIVHPVPIVNECVRKCLPNEACIFYVQCTFTVYMLIWKVYLLMNMSYFKNLRTKKPALLLNYCLYGYHSVQCFV